MHCLPNASLQLLQCLACASVGPCMYQRTRAWLHRSEYTDKNVSLRHVLMIQNKCLHWRFETNVWSRVRETCLLQPLMRIYSVTDKAEFRLCTRILPRGRLSRPHKTNKWVKHACSNTSQELHVYTVAFVYATTLGGDIRGLFRATKLDYGRCYCRQK